MNQRSAIAIATLLWAAPTQADFQISADDGDSHSYPSVCRTPDGFVAAWESRSANGRDVTIQKLDSNGRPTDAPSQANQETNGDQQLPDIACRADGSFLVVWESRGQDGDALGVFARNFNTDGSPAGNEFQVNTYTTDDQRRPRLCTAPDGAAVVVWDSFGQDGDGAGVYLQRYNPDSSPLGDERVINNETAESQSEPVIACGTDGRQLIAWTNRQSALKTDIRARLMFATGDLASNVRRLSSANPDDSGRHPFAAAMQDGRFLVALSDNEATLELATIDLGETGGGSVTTRSLRFEGRMEAPAVAADSNNNILLAWSRGSGFDFDVAGLRHTPGSPDDRLFTANSNRDGNDGALSTLGRGIDVATDVAGDIVVWQKRNVFADNSTSAIFAQRFKNCIGDCSGDGVVRVNELIVGVRIALNQAATAECPLLDVNSNGGVEINELVRAVGEALASICPSPVS